MYLPLQVSGSQKLYSLAVSGCDFTADTTTLEQEVIRAVECLGIDELTETNDFHLDAQG